MDWQVDITELLTLIGKTIYRPENVLVELGANSYDADASRVEITSSGVYVVSESGPKRRAFEITDALKATTLLPGGSIIVPSYL